MEDGVLCGIYDCTVKTKIENWPKLIKAIDIYLSKETILIDFSGNKELTIPNVYCLKDLFDIMCSLSEDKGENWSLSSAVEMYLIYINQTPQGKKMKLTYQIMSGINELEYVDKLLNFRNHLVDVLNSGKIRSVNTAFKSEFIEHNSSWRLAEKEFLPEVGVPVIVLTTNDCVGIDWVNEPNGNTPFAHYNVKGWSPIVGSHIEVNKKQEVY